MSRPQSKIKLGFYPTPPSVVKSIIRLLDPPRLGRFAMLDPSAGQGKALDDLRRAFLNSWSYAIDMSEERGPDLAALNFTQSAQVDAINEVKYAKHGLDLLYFNPPYDTDPEHERLEKAFFQRIIIDHRSLTPGGVFIGILPESCFNALWFDLNDYLTDVSVFMFPYPDFHYYRQHVVLGYMRASKRRMDDPSRRQDADVLSMIMQTRAPGLGAASVRYQIPSRDSEPQPFTTHAFQPDHGRTMVSQYGYQTKSLMRTALQPTLKPQIQTLVPLDAPFVGIALAGSLFNNMALSFPDGRFCLVKGFTTKVDVYSHSTVKVHSDGDTTETDTYVEKFNPVIYELDLDTGQLALYELPDPEKAPVKART